MPVSIRKQLKLFEKREFNKFVLEIFPSQLQN